MIKDKATKIKLRFRGETGSVYDDPNDPTTSPWLDPDGYRAQRAEGIARRIGAAFARRFNRK